MTDERITSLLRYWLQCIRYEEALAARPKSWRSEGLRNEAVNVENPTAGRLYFKLSLADTAALLASSIETVERPVEGEIAEFFESWLARQYDRGPSVDNGPEMMVTCPTVQLGRGELAGLLRFGVQLDFEYDDKERFIVPSRSARKRHPLPPPPTRARIQRVDVAEGPPFFVDGRLLTRELCATEEETDALFETLGRAVLPAGDPAHFLGLIASHLDGRPPDGEVMGLLERLAQEMSARLGQGSSAGHCYPVAIVMDASRARTTWHLQREMEKLIRFGETIPERRALHTYLTGKPLRVGSKPVMGLFGESGLTLSQKEAAMAFLGSPFTAVEGPPGTGKTTLVLHLAAHRLVERIAVLSRTGKMPEALMVVVSTNNRAVDNVIEPLSQPLDPDDLPMAIRVGSRRVCEKVLAPELLQVLGWLNAHSQGMSEEARAASLAMAIKQFTKQQAELEALLAPERRRLEAMEQKGRLEASLKALEETISKTAQKTIGDIEGVKRARTTLSRLEERLQVLSAKCEGRPSKKRIKEVRRYCEQEVVRPAEKAMKSLARLGWPLHLVVAPDTKNADPLRALSLFEAAAEQAIDMVADTILALDQALSEEKRLREMEKVQRQLCDLVIPPQTHTEAAVEDEKRRALFRQAVAVRNAYAAAHAKRLHSAVLEAFRAAEEQASLRHFGRTRPELMRALARLFPVWGCTLLSMGNVFDDDPLSIDQVIIDEAGQCHPAYGISALMRSASAMILGDVHQLTPIFGLSEQDERPIGHGVFGPGGVGDGDWRIFDKSHTSVQVLAERAVPTVRHLTDHFRCQKDIIEISDRLCGYGLTVHTPVRSRGDMVPLLDRPVLFIPISGEQERQGGSWHNRAELQAIVGWLDRILGSGIAPEEVAVITPYRGQLFQIRRALIARGLPIETSLELMEEDGIAAPVREEPGLAIGTVHRFQGGERSIVIFSTVVTRPQSLRFLNERVNLLNVAVSRAKEHLLVIGHEPALAEGRLTHLLLRAIEEGNMY